MNKFTVLWFNVGSHGYNEVTAISAHEALSSVSRTLNGAFANKCRFVVFDGWNLRGTDYCMRHMTTMD
jgi:hypothetical protein